jgi:myo-inositol 2-dehydrogenase / D-chiro-inositol 1-dehydrogenase
MSNFNIAMFGAGRIGNVHGRNIVDHPETTLKYIVDPMEAPAKELAAKLGATYTDEATALGDPDVHAILVASATSTHADLIFKGLSAGKGVFCEKPVDLDISRVKATLHAVKDMTPPLLIGFNRRFDPGVAELRVRIDAGEIGDVEIATVASKDPSGPPAEYLKASGGLFRDMTIHDFDMVRFILGEEPIAVTATAATLTDPAIAKEGDIDTAIITLQCGSGRMAVITNSRRASFGYDQRVEVHGSLGTLRTENVPKHMLVRETNDGVLRAKPKFFFTDRYAESYQAEWAHFVRALKGEEKTNPTGNDGYRALLLAEAAYVSLTEGRRVEVAEVEAGIK